MAPTGKKLYKKVLKDIADNLTFSDVGTLKFVCRGTIGAGALDKVPNGEPLKLFRLLEERLIISEENLTWLRGVLKKIQRVDLAMKIPDEFCQYIDVVDSAEMVCGNPLSGGRVDSDVVSPYRVLLKAVADDLTHSNVSEMKFLMDVPDGISEKLNDGQDLLMHLEHSGKLSENNFNDLKDLLTDVYRMDLIKRIEEFSINEGQPPLQPIPPVSLSRDPASCYPMHQPYGFALIINNQFFEGTTGEGFVLNERRGSHVDFRNLDDLWQKLGFIVEKHENLKAHQICTVVDNMVKKLNKNQSSSCFVCCIMTHGAMGTIYGSDCNFINIKHITDSFKETNCPALVGKPKLFFIQACRGRQYLTGRTLLAGNTGSSNTATPATGTTTQEPPSTQDPLQQINQTPGLDSDASPAEATTVTDEDQYDNMNDSAFRHNADPNEAHFLLGYSTAPGYVSIRSIDHGTWYVNALVKIFDQHYTSEDVMQMMVRVNGLVTEAYSSQGYKQCPVPVFTLAKSLYF